MPRLLLVRHARPQRTDAAPEEWPLAEAAGDDVVLLADALGIGDDVAVASSTELKALATAQVLNRRSSLKVAVEFREVAKPWYADLREHEAATASYFAGKEVPGWEVQTDAVARFRRGLDECRRVDDLAVVTHGTIMTLWLAATVDIGDPFRFWSELRMPDAWSVDEVAGSATRLHG